MFELSIDKSIFNLNKMFQNKQNNLGTKIAIFGILEIFKKNICNRVQMLKLNISRVWTPLLTWISIVDWDFH